MPLAARAYEDFAEGLNRGWGEQVSRSPKRLQLERAGVRIEESADAIRKARERDSE